MNERVHVAARNGFFYLLVLLLSTLACSACEAEQAQPVAPQGPAAETAGGPDFPELRATLEQAVTSNKLRGVSLLLVKDGTVLFKAAYGNLSVDDEIKIASSTKPVATVGILVLVDEGKLSLDDTAGSLLPEFRGTRAENATLRQLLSHQAGILGRYPGGRPRKGTLADFSRLISERGSLKTPGGFSYSGVSIDIACRMAEVAAGVPIEEHLRTRVWLPLDMTHSGFGIAADSSSVSSTQRARGEGRYVSCGGGMTSTLEDMANFYEMLLNGGVYDGKRLISEGMHARMISKQGQNPRKLDDPYTTGEYGLGIYRDRVAADGSPLTISHGGALGTMPWADLDTGLIGVFFSQSSLRKVQSLIAEVQVEARGRGGMMTAPAPADSSKAETAPGRMTSEQGGMQASARSFNRISKGAEVINLKQFRDFIENESRNSRLKENPDMVEHLFKRLDQNSDGVVSLEEYSRLGEVRR